MNTIWLTGLSTMTLTATLFISRVVTADQLSDFKTAAEKRGCEAVPYSLEQSTCNSLSRTKDEVCRNFSCSLDKTKRLVEKLQEKKNLREAKERKNESAVRDLERLIDRLEDDIDEAKKEANDRIRQADKFVRAREDVQKHFERIRSKVESERDESLKPFISKLVSHYKSEKEGHMRPIEEVKKARDNCDKVSRISY